MAEGRAITLSLAGLGAILGVVATGWSAWNSARLSEQQHFNDYQLGVFNAVIDALTNSDPDRIEAVQLLVANLPDDAHTPNGVQSMREDMLVLLCRRANSIGHGDSVRETCALTPTAVPDEEAASIAEVSAPAAVIDGLTSAAPATPPGPVAEISRQQADEQARAVDFGARSSSITQVGALWNVDVFACEGDAAAQARAHEVFGILSAEATAPRPESGITLGRVRERVLSESLNARSNFSVHRDEVRAEAGEAEAGAALRELIQSRNGPAFNQMQSTTQTPFYLSVFLCGSEVERPEMLRRSASAAG